MDFWNLFGIVLSIVSALETFQISSESKSKSNDALYRLMHRMIPHQLHDSVFVYLDDLLIASATLEEHTSLLEEVARLL